MESREVRVVLPQPHKAQLQVLDSKARFKVLMCGRRFGKSLIALVIAITHILNGKKVAYLTPEFSLAKEFYREFLKYLPELIIKSQNKTDLEITLITGGVIKFFSGEAIESFRGRKFHLVILDEAAFISDLESAWNQTIRPTLTDYKGEALFISTPKGKRYFDSLYQKGLRGEDGFESFHFTSYDNPYLDKSEIDSAKASLPEAVFRQEYLAIPQEDAGNPFGTSNIRKNIITELSTEPTQVFGIDVARVNDFSCIVGLDSEGKLSHFERFRQPWEYTMDRIRALPAYTTKVMDATGVGDVLFEQLSLEVPNLISFKFTTESKPRIIYQLIKDVEAGNLKYNQTIADEMGTLEYKYTSTGHIKFEAASGYNDDCVMALALANSQKRYTKKIEGWKLYLA
jgi:phage FluMu gp28-like protein